MANVSLPYIFSDNMVLQRNSKIPVWGFASPHEKVSVSFKNQTKSTVADQNGNWKVDLDQEKEGGPFTLTIKGNNEIVSLLLKSNYGLDYFPTNIPNKYLYG